MAYLVDSLADFVAKAAYEDLSETAGLHVRIRLLDSLACAIGALGGGPVAAIREQTKDFGGRELCTLIGGGRTAPDRAAFLNGALVRYLDFSDSYLAKGETCHPSDNIAAVLAAAEYGNSSGKDFMAAVALAYQVQCRLSDVAPVRAKGFDHTVQLAYSAAAGVARVLGLERAQVANAIAISGTSYNSLRVTRTGPISNWKGLAAPNTAAGAAHAAFLAMRGISGPREVFEGNKGFMDSISGHFEIDWIHEDLERITRTIVKKYNAEIHSQATIDAALELKQRHKIQANDIKQIDIETFDVAFNIIGGGEEGDKTIVRTKEEADHSLPYMVAVALLDGEVMPEQYDRNRINSPDAQELLKKITIKPSPEFSRRFPEEMGCRITVVLKDGRTYDHQKKDYEGFVTRPITWERIIEKFKRLSYRNLGDTLQQEIIDAVANLDNIQIGELGRVLSQVQYQ